MFLLWFLACLEKVTGEEIPLDPRFYAAVEEMRGSADGGGGASTPFSSTEGDKIIVSGIILSEESMAVDIDVRVPDPTAPGGMAGKGKILLERPKDFSLSVPKNLGSLELQAFQDIDSDGPNAEDPFGQVILTVEEDDISDVEITLVKGARGAAPIHQEVAPEEDSEQRKGIPENPDPFGGVAGNRISLKGVLTCGECTNIDLDLFTPDSDSPGGRSMLGKMKLPPGNYEILVPENFGELILEAFVDLDENGPSSGDLMGVYQGNPVRISSSNISSIDIELSVHERMPMMPQ